MNNTGFEIAEKEYYTTSIKKQPYCFTILLFVLIEFFEDVIAKIPSCYYQICILTYTHKSIIILK